MIISHLRLQETKQEIIKEVEIEISETPAATLQRDTLGKADDQQHIIDTKCRNKSKLGTCSKQTKDGYIKCWYDIMCS